MVKVVSNQSGYTVDVFQIEANFDVEYAHTWFRDHWSDSIRYAALYFILVIAGRWYMETQPRFELRTPLALWNSCLATLCICGAVRTVPELFYILDRYGFNRSVCDISYRYGPTAVWVYIFTFEKLLALGDTAFIVLRKQKLRFLHWYHHASAMVYGFYSYSDPPSTIRWFLVMNIVVHSFMYTYYTFRGMKFLIPKVIMITITSLQILQMIMAIFVTIQAFLLKASGERCDVSDNNLRFSFVMYVSYLVLFVHFFYDKYIAKKCTEGTENGVSKDRKKAE